MIEELIRILWALEERVRNETFSRLPEKTKEYKSGYADGIRYAARLLEEEAQ